MTVARRVVVCLDVDAGRVVKGTRFVDLKDMGEPVALAERYAREGADEVVYLDISASHEGRRTTLDMVRRTAERLDIPLTVGGGVRSPEDMREALAAGADKVAVNTAAVEDPALITACSERFGAQCVVVAVDGKRRPDGSWGVFTHGGRTDTGRDVLDWCTEAARRGAGEILLTSMDADGTRAGFDLEMTRAVARAVDVPVVASGGCGEAAHMVDVLAAGADAALAAGMFHDGTTTVPEVKSRLLAAGVPVRPPDEPLEAPA